VLRFIAARNFQAASKNASSFRRRFKFDNDETKKPAPEKLRARRRAAPLSGFLWCGMKLYRRMDGAVA
jgi:hypothetical protein